MLLTWVRSWHGIFFSSIFSIKPVGPAYELRYPWHAITDITKEKFASVVAERRNDPCPFSPYHGHRASNCIACIRREAICIKKQATAILISIDNARSTAVVDGANAASSYYRTFIIIEKLLQEVELGLRGTGTEGPRVSALVNSDSPQWLFAIA